jgi:hypothetical protein
MTYEELLEAARADPRVLGLVLTGSRGIHAFVRRQSDWDVRLVVAGRALRECEKRYETARGSAVEVAVHSLEQLEQAGEIGSPNEWDRYSYVHAEVVLDKLEGAIAPTPWRSSSASSATSRSWRASGGSVR